MFQPLNNTTESVVLCCYLPENYNNNKYYLPEEAQRVKYCSQRLFSEEKKGQCTIIIIFMVKLLATCGGIANHSVNF